MGEHRERREVVRDRAPRRIGTVLVVLVLAGGVGWLLMTSGSSDGGGGSLGDSDIAPPGSDLVEDLLDGEEVTDAPDLAEGDALAAQGVVEQFVDHVRAGETDAAAALWTGYPDDLGQRHDNVVAFAAEFSWLVTTPSYRTIVTAGFGWTQAVPVVTVVGEAAPGSPPPVAAFVVSPRRDGDGSDLPPGAMEIRRLPTATAEAIEPPPGSPVAAGQPVSVGVQPVEGGVTIHVDGLEVTTRVEMAANQPIAFEMPASDADYAVVTVSSATPEELYAHAYVYAVP